MFLIFACLDLCALCVLSRPSVEPLSSGGFYKRAYYRARRRATHSDRICCTCPNRKPNVGWLYVNFSSCGLVRYLWIQKTTNNPENNQPPLEKYSVRDSDDIATVKQVPILQLGSYHTFDFRPEQESGSLEPTQHSTTR